MIYIRFLNDQTSLITYVSNKTVQSFTEDYSYKLFETLLLCANGIGILGVELLMLNRNVWNSAV